jgi:hypothetical protein
MSAKPGIYDVTLYTDESKASAAIFKAKVSYSPEYSEITTWILEKLNWTITPLGGKRIDELSWKNHDIVMVAEDPFVVLDSKIGKDSGELTIGFEHAYAQRLGIGQSLDAGNFSIRLAGIEDGFAYLQIEDNAIANRKNLIKLQEGEIMETGYYDLSGNPFFVHLQEIGDEKNKQTASFGIYSDIYILEHGKNPASILEGSAGVNKHYAVSIGSIDGKYFGSGTTIALICDDIGKMNNGEKRLLQGGFIHAPTIFKNCKLVNEGLSRREAVQISIESISNEKLIMADELEPNKPNGKVESGTFVHFACHGEPIFGLIYNGTAMGRITDIKADFEAGKLCYREQDSPYYILKPLPEGITVGNIRVNDGNVSGDGAIIYIDSMNKHIGITANARPQIKTENFVYAYIPYAKGLYDYQFGKVQYKGLGEDEFELYDGPLWDQRTNKIMRVSSKRIEIEFSKDITKSTNQLSVKYEKRSSLKAQKEKREKYRAKTLQRPSFSMEQEVRIELPIQSPENADVKIYAANGEQVNVWVNKHKQGFSIFPGALNPGVYSYAVNDEGRISKGTFNIRFWGQ